MTSEKKRVSGTIVILLCLACLVCGYFAGREHLKYEFRAALSDALKEAQERIAANLGGMISTPDEIESGEDDEKARKNAIQEIQALLQRKEETEIAKKKLEEFRVLRSEFSMKKNSLLEKPLVSLTVKNDTVYPISRAYFLGTLVTPGRSVPWLKKEFNYSIPGGLEPGEEANWKLAPNMFSEWGKVEKRPDMVLNVEVTGIDGPDGKSLFPISFTDSDEIRLEALRNSLKK